MKEVVGVMAGMDRMKEVVREVEGVKGIEGMEGMEGEGLGHRMWSRIRNSAV